MSKKKRKNKISHIPKIPKIQWKDWQTYDYLLSSVCAHRPVPISNGLVYGGKGHDFKDIAIDIILDKVSLSDDIEIIDSFGEIVDKPRKILLPITDGEIPKQNPSIILSVVNSCLRVLRDRRNIKIDCIGGHGRTGLFMALLAHKAGIENPIFWIRTVYCEKAIETIAQERYILNFVATY